MCLERGRDVHTEFSRGNFLDSIKFEYTDQAKFYDRPARSMIPLMKQEFAVTHTIRQTKISALADSCVTNTPSVKMPWPQKKIVSIVFP
jgi:hypothetical protein